MRGVDDQIDNSWKQRLANSNLSGPTRSTSGRLPLKVADGSIIRTKLSTATVHSL